MVFKKLGDELLNEYLEVIQHLGGQNLHVVVEPRPWREYLAHRSDMQHVCSYAPDEEDRCAAEGITCRWKSEDV